MQNGYFSSGLIALAFVLANSGFILAQDDDPTIEEKPLSQLIKQLRSDNRGFQLRAAQALSKAPAELYPKIVPSLIPLLKSDRENDRFVAAQTLGNYGPAAKAAVPDLLPMLEGTQYERNRAAAAKALGQILKDAAPSDEIEKVTQKLIAVFRDQYPDVQRESVTACGMIGLAAKSCLPHLVPPLEFAIRGHGEDAPYLVIRRATAWTLGRMGPLSAGYMDRLISLLHIDGVYAPEIPEAIGLIGPINDNVAKNLVDAMESAGRPIDAVGLKISSLKALERFGPKSALAVPYLVRCLREAPKWSVPKDYVLAVIRVFSAIGPEAKDASAILKTYAEMKSFGQSKPEEVAEINKASTAALAAVTGQPAPAEDKK